MLVKFGMALSSAPARTGIPTAIEAASSAALHNKLFVNILSSH